jgi:tripeptide aminopeptidase
MSRYEEIAANAIKLAVTIQAIPAPTFNEGQRAEFFLKTFQELGLQDVQRDPVGNVLGRLPGTGKSLNDARPLVVSAHTDTVHPLGTPLHVRIFEDRIIGPGIGDNALGLAALLSLIHLLKDEQARLPGDLWLVANVCEEGLGNLRGMQAVVDRFGAQPLAYLVLEGMGLGTVLHRGLGVERYRISIETPGGHSWVNYGQPSAIHELCGLVTRLASIPLPERPCTTMNAGIIQGGTSINTIAAHAWLELDLRSEDKNTLARLVNTVKTMVQTVQRHNVQVQIERIGQREAGELPENHPLIGLARGVLSDLGIFSRLDINSTDANLPLSRGYPAICVGITHGNNAHSVDEFILKQPVAKGLEQLYLLVTRAWDTLA